MRILPGHAQPSAPGTLRSAGQPANPAAAVPTAEELFGDQGVPFIGMGAVWVRPDGLVLIETADHGGLAFFADASSLHLVETDGEVHFSRPVAGQAALHEFTAGRAVNGGTCNAVYRHVGDLWLDYVESSGRLDVRVEGGKEVFQASFDFRDSRQTGTLRRPEENPDIVGGGATCSCDCFHPQGGSCNAGKACPEGFECACRCECPATGARCTCSECKRARRSGVTIRVGPDGGATEPGR
jgi:hypothetical protein